MFVCLCVCGLKGYIREGREGRKRSRWSRKELLRVLKLVPLVVPLTEPQVHASAALYGKVNRNSQKVEPVPKPPQHWYRSKYIAAKLYFSNKAPRGRQTVIIVHLDSNLYEPLQAAPLGERTNIVPPTGMASVS